MTSSGSPRRLCLQARPSSLARVGIAFTMATARPTTSLAMSIAPSQVCPQHDAVWVACAYQRRRDKGSRLKLYRTPTALINSWHCVVADSVRDHRLKCSRELNAVYPLAVRHAHNVLGVADRTGHLQRSFAANELILLPELHLENACGAPDSTGYWVSLRTAVGCGGLPECRVSYELK